MSSQSEDSNKSVTKSNILDYFGAAGTSSGSKIKNSINSKVRKHGGNNRKNPDGRKTKNSLPKTQSHAASSAQQFSDDSYTLLGQDPMFSPIKHMTSDIREINASCETRICRCKPLDNSATFDVMKKQSNELLEIVKEQNNVINKLINGVISNNTGINSVVNRSNEITEVIEGLRKSSNVHSDQIEKLKVKSEFMHEENNLLSTRVEKLETIQEAKALSSKLYIIPLCKDEMDAIEKGNESHLHALYNIFNSMKIKYDRSHISNVRIRDGMRKIKGERRFIKMLLIDFLNDKAAGKIFAQIVAHNSENVQKGKQPRYFAELPTGRKIGLLRFLCNKLKLEGHISKIYINEYGITVQYPSIDKNEKESSIKSVLITCEDDINKLRKTLKIKDAHIPISDVYKVNDRPLKRSRKSNSYEEDDSHDNHENKKPLFERTQTVSVKDSGESEFEMDLSLHYSTPKQQ
ncbi:hypothetical protein PVAND_015503 [Polypedilum vanderplanki]|uniref:Uncharacterized protein n=1 Tax=Polypedilum vanderplanki TaxID=319348 RepID=A0A9J6BCF1_POLVA|nr:hypothetical protein PVAND_015503 [Polypedilum vanderplanki]